MYVPPNAWHPQRMPLTALPSYMCVHTAINFTLVEQRLLIAPHFSPLELQANLNPIMVHWCLIFADMRSGDVYFLELFY